MAPYGVTLLNPSRNYIDVIKREPRKGIVGTRTVGTRLCRIGFPGWTKQVSEKISGQSARKLISPMTRVSKFQTFFKGVDSLGALIAEYEPALRRLAER